MKKKLFPTFRKLKNTFLGIPYYLLSKTLQIPQHSKICLQYFQQQNLIFGQFQVVCSLLKIYLKKLKHTTANLTISKIKGQVQNNLKKQKRSKGERNLAQKLF